MVKTVDATAVLVKYTYVGDVDLNGRIDGDDYFWIDLGYEAHANGWGSGDLNYDARVDADDYFLSDIAFTHRGQTCSAQAIVVLGSLLLGGCTSYYKVTDPATGNVHCTTKIDENFSGAAHLMDARTGEKLHPPEFRGDQDQQGTIRAGQVCRSDTMPAMK